MLASMKENNWTIRRKQYNPSPHFQTMLEGLSVKEDPQQEGPDLMRVETDGKIVCYQAQNEGEDFDLVNISEQLPEERKSKNPQDRFFDEGI